MQTLLYEYWRSSASYRVRLALNLAGISYDSIAVNLLTGEQVSTENRARNPQGLVPTLIIDGVTLTQSLAVIEYLNDTRACGFLPDDPVGKARVRALSHAIAMEIHPICNLSVAQYAVGNSEGGITQEGWMQHFITNGLSAFENMLTDAGDCCYGDAITMADLCLLPQLYNATRWGVDLGGMPKISAISARLNEVKAIAAAHPDRHKPETP